MFSEKLPETLRYLADESGLRYCPRFFSDAQFIAALMTGVVVVWIAHAWYPQATTQLQLTWTVLLSIVVWQPFIEELLFRGMVQGQLRKFDWGQRELLKITAANGVTSLLFAGVHLLYSQPLWALGIVFPSLLFGYFRDHYNSVYPAIVLHSAYNIMVVITVLVYGDAVIAPLTS